MLIDEPSVGLAPVLVKRTIEKIKELKERHQITYLGRRRGWQRRYRDGASQRVRRPTAYPS